MDFNKKCSCYCTCHLKKDENADISNVNNNYYQVMIINIIVINHQFVQDILQEKLENYQITIDQPFDINSNLNSNYNSNDIQGITKLLRPLYNLNYK
jgi:hypothetical protein